MSTRRERRKEKAISRRNTGPSPSAPGSGKPTTEEVQQERSFFIWTGVITLLVVVLLYFVMTR